jgi:hypothetical protein
LWIVTAAPVQEGRAHLGREGDEGLLLAFLLDLDDGGGRDLRLLGPDDVEREKPGFLPGPR